MCLPSENIVNNNNDNNNNNNNECSKSFLFCAVYRYKYACYENNTLIRLDNDQLSLPRNGLCRSY